MMPLCRKLLCCVLALVSALAQAEPTLPVWPEPPEKARIAYLQSVTRAEDLGIEKGFWTRLSDWVFGEADHRLVRPMAVVVLGRTLYVADPGARGVHRFDPDKGRHDLIAGPADAPLPSPVALARGSAGEVYVADSKQAQVLVIPAEGRTAQPLMLDRPLTQPTGIAYDAATERLYVADTAEHRIEVFDRRGRWLQSIGRRGEGAGEFNFPTHLWLSADGGLWVTDALNFRLQRFDTAGRHVSGFGRRGGGSGELARPKGIASDRDGHLYVVDSMFHAFQIFDEAGRLLLAVGAQGQAPGEFWLPNGIYIDPDEGGRIYVADTYNRRIQILRYLGDRP